MKTINLLLSILVLLSSLSVKATTSEIKHVIVYRQGAKITRTAVVNLKPGNQEVIIGNLTTTIDPNSLQVNIKGSAVLLSASVQQNFLGYRTLPARTKQLEDSLKLLKDQIEWLNNEQAISQGEEKLILENQKIVNEKEKITANDIAQLADFYRTRLTLIRKMIYKNNLKIRDLTDTKQRIEQQLQNIQYQKGQKMGEVVLNVSASQATKVTVQLSYLTRNAGWQPLYDIRCQSISEPVEMLYKANVWQTSGYDWKNVNLVISTGNPTANNDRPILNPWYIDFYYPPVYSSGASRKYKSAAVATSAMNLMVADEMAAEPLMKEEAVVPYEVTTSESQMATEFQIEVKQDIPTDGKPHVVPISVYDLPAKYNYHSVPKLDQHAYLIARIADYSRYDLLPGKTNIFFEGMYIGQSYLNPQVTSDSLIISMGRDDRISVKRNLLTDLTSKKIIGGNKKEQKGYEIILRNNKKQEVTVEMLDQIPIAQNKEIVVELEETGGAEYNADYGKLSWNINLKPGETKKIRFIYSVKYPKDKQIQGL